MEPDDPIDAELAATLRRPALRPGFSRRVMARVDGRISWVPEFLEFAGAFSILLFVIAIL